MKEKRDALLDERARAMRNEMTPTEILLWNELRSEKLGVRFVRQAVIDRYIVDFLAPATKLVVEVDGLWHRGRETNDTRRDALLRAIGFRVLRVTAEEVETEMAEVLRRVREGI